MLMSIEHIAKKYAVKPILDDVSFAIEDYDRMALVGINGTGKTTLLKILTGLEQPDSGTIIRKKELRIAYLEQEPVLNDAATILEEVLSHGQKSAEYEAKSILNRLGMQDLSMTCAHLSGGQKKRVALAKALLEPCDLLILDEPTNHLDAVMISWLENYLKRLSAAVLMVTHDRYFMERICDHMLELSRGKIYVYEANYSAYLEEKEKRLELERSREAKRQSFLKKELEWVRAGVQARTTKSRSRLQRFEKLNAQTYEEINEQIDLSFASSRLGKKTILCENIGKQFNGKVLFEHFDLQLKRHDRIGIIGENGCGKTTLLRILAQELKPDQGQVIYGDTVRVGYFHQGHEEMDPSMRVIDYIRESGDEIDTGESRLNASQMLERFLFDAGMQYAKISLLSGGEKRRLYLLKVLMGAPNILFLDEPTNDLDITTLAILEDYLDQFPGIVITVSHDRYFLDRVCDSLLVFQNSSIIACSGAFSENEALILQRPQASAVSKKTNKRETTVLKMSSKEKKELEGMEDAVAALEDEIACLDQQMGSSTDFLEIEKLSTQRKQLEDELEAKMEQWILLNEKKEKIDEMIKK